MTQSTVRFLAVLTLLTMVVAAIAVPTVVYRFAERRYPRLTDNPALTAVGLLMLATSRRALSESGASAHSTSGSATRARSPPRVP
jgi:hypothetical protein